MLSGAEPVPLSVWAIYGETAWDPYVWGTFSQRGSPSDGIVYPEADPGRRTYLPGYCCGHRRSGGVRFLCGDGIRAAGDSLFSGPDQRDCLKSHDRIHQKRLAVIYQGFFVWYRISFFAQRHGGYLQRGNWWTGELCDPHRSERVSYLQQAVYP